MFFPDSGFNKEWCLFGAPEKNNSEEVSILWQNTSAARLKRHRSCTPLRD